MELTNLLSAPQCAVLGGNLKLLTWLVDEHCCPLRSIRISDGKQRDNSGSYTPILTSKGRSLLSIALSNKNIGIVRYLVVEKRMLLSAEKGLSVETLVENLDLVLRVLPEEIMGEQSLDQSETRNMSYTSATQNIDNTGPVEQDSMITATCVDGETEDEASGEEVSFLSFLVYMHSTLSALNHTHRFALAKCIICCSNDINCVITPCGHQICCLECSRNISRCPVCSAECEFMRVFKP